MTVDLPEPVGPTRAKKSASVEVDVTVCRGRRRSPRSRARAGASAPPRWLELVVEQLGEQRARGARRRRPARRGRRRTARGRRRPGAARTRSASGRGRRRSIGPRGRSGSSARTSSARPARAGSVTTTRSRSSPTSAPAAQLGERAPHRAQPPGAGQRDRRDLAGRPGAASTTSTRLVVGLLSPKSTAIGEPGVPDRAGAGSSGGGGGGRARRRSADAGKTVAGDVVVEDGLGVALAAAERAARRPCRGRRRG